MAAGCFIFNPFRAQRRGRKSLLPSPSSSPETEETAEEVKEKRLDSLKSWSVLLESNEAVEETPQAAEWTAADLSQLVIGNKFAAGAHSRIYRGIYKGRAVAVKIVRIVGERREGTRTRLENQFYSEVALLSSLYHPNIVQFIAACKKPNVYCIITEYMSQGTLRMYLNNKEPYSLSIETILRLALDISRGMAYLHSQGVIHRDLKSSNLLLNDDMHVKVADFGNSCLERQCHKATGNMGTYRWMAPEMIKGKPYTHKIDVYSFGIVLWELTTSLMPFQGMNPVRAAFAVSQKNERPPLPETCQAALVHLIERCWAPNPSKRPTFSYIVSALERYDKCVKEGLPLTLHYPGLGRRKSIFGCFKGCISINPSTHIHPDCFLQLKTNDHK